MQNNLDVLSSLPPIPRHPKTDEPLVSYSLEVKSDYRTIECAIPPPKPTRIYTEWIDDPYFECECCGDTHHCCYYQSFERTDEELDAALKKWERAKEEWNRTQGVYYMACAPETYLEGRTKRGDQASFMLAGDEWRCLSWETGE